MFAASWSPRNEVNNGGRGDTVLTVWVKGGQRTRGPRTATHLLCDCGQGIPHLPELSSLPLILPVLGDSGA